MGCRKEKAVYVRCASIETHMGRCDWTEHCKSIHTVDLQI